MNYHNASFLASYGTAEQLPPSTLHEVAFTGRSNVGKSSLLNKLMYRKGLAKVSSAPGKTATINFYDIDKGSAHFVDLPGYGYAKVSQQEKLRWAELIEGYFNQERSLALVVALVDIRHDPSAQDVHMIQFLRELDLPFLVVLTKADKISKQKAAQNTARARRLLDLGKDATVLITSSEKGISIDELRKLIDAHL